MQSIVLLLPVSRSLASDGDHCVRTLAIYSVEHRIQSVAHKFLYWSISCIAVLCVFCYVLCVMFVICVLLCVLLYASQLLKLHTLLHLAAFRLQLFLEMGKQPNSSRTNWTKTLVLLRTVSELENSGHFRTEPSLNLYFNKTKPEHEFDSSFKLVSN